MILALREFFDKFNLIVKTPVTGLIIDSTTVRRIYGQPNKRSTANGQSFYTYGLHDLSSSANTLCLTERTPYYQYEHLTKDQRYSPPRMGDHFGWASAPQVTLTAPPMSGVDPDHVATRPLSRRIDLIFGPNNYSGSVNDAPGLPARIEEADGEWTYDYFTGEYFTDGGGSTEETTTGSYSPFPGVPVTYSFFSMHTNQKWMSFNSFSGFHAGRVTGYTITGSAPVTPSVSIGTFDPVKNNTPFSITTTAPPDEELEGVITQFLWPPVLFSSWPAGESRYTIFPLRNPVLRFSGIKFPPNPPEEYYTYLWESLGSESLTINVRERKDHRWPIILNIQGIGGGVKFTVS